VAQTKRKRKRKHRGTPAGTIERAGRTGRPQTREDAKQIARQRRAERLDTPPTWRSALNRAAFAAAILVIFISVVQKNVVQGLIMGIFALLIYVPMSYYTDLWLYRRRQAKKAGAGR
jgi:hypothetical protein